MILTRVLIIVFLVFPLTSFAQDKQMPVDKIDEIQKLDRLINKVEQVEKLAENISNEKYYKCLKAFGNNEYCKCLADNLPIRVTFENYILIVTSNRDELGYKDLKDEDKKMVNITYKTRNTCVDLVSAKKIKEK